MDRRITIKWAVALICLLIYGCETDKGQNQTKNKLIFLLDKSSSVDFKESDQITSILNESVDFVKNEGDNFIMMYVHSNTLGSNPEINYAIHAIPIRNEKDTQIEYNQKKQYWGKQIRNEKLDLLQQLKRNVFVKNANQTNQSTDLWAIFEKLSTFCDSSTNNRIIIFSDMIESMKGDGRRSKLNPSSKNEAEEWAMNDKLIIDKNFKVEMSSLKDAKVQVVLPYNALSSTFNANIRYYWEKLFTLYGMEVQSFK